MATKGKGKSKGKAMKFDLEFSTKKTAQYQGALDNSYYFRAQMANKKWYKVRIIDCRLAKDYDTTKKKTQNCYQYYVHYQKIDRRMDQWLTFDRLQSTSQLIINEPIKKKKKNNTNKPDKQDSEAEENGLDPQQMRLHQQITKFKTINQCQMGNYRFKTWYYSPYPAFYQNVECLYLCEYCLSFYITQKELIRHTHKCPLFHPPGDQIYRDSQQKISVYLTDQVFEIDGLKNPVFCQNLCYLSKLFLDHKNLYWDTTPFLFYVLCQYDQNSYHIAGYFSKQKESQSGYNLSCILVLPFHQRKGFAKFLITLSYQLSLRENRLGTPEVLDYIISPLSDLGKAVYISWWTQRIIQFMRKHQDQNYSLSDISKQTGIKQLDILDAMQTKKIIKYQQGQPIICNDQNYLNQIYKKAGQPGKTLKVEQLHWIPHKLKWDNVPI